MNKLAIPRFWYFEIIVKEDGTGHVNKSYDLIPLFIQISDLKNIGLLNKGFSQFEIKRLVNSFYWFYFKKHFSMGKILLGEFPVNFFKHWQKFVELMNVFFTKSDYLIYYRRGV